MFDDETPVAWTALRRQTPVVGADGSEIGTLEEVLGDQDDDIFHGLVVKRGGDRVELPAAHVKKMTERHIVTDLDSVGADSLSAYRR